MRRPSFAAPLPFSILTNWENTLIDEILTTRLLLTASVDPTRFGFGIVSATDPKTATPTAASTLSVAVDAADNTKIDINPGIAVFPNGEFIRITTLLQQIQLANSASNAQNVVYLQFAESTGTEFLLTHSQTLVNAEFTYLPNQSSYVAVADIATYNAFSSTQLQTIVPLAVVSVEVTSTGNVLVIDHNTSILATNRPWFTAVDIFHRSQLGTGTASPTNPHAMSLSDLSATSGKTLFQLELEHGMIVGKDISIGHIAGLLCSETILPTAVFTDTTGAITGIISAKFFRTSRMPLVLISATNQSSHKDYAINRIPRTNLFFFNPGEPYDGTNTLLTYMCVAAAEPPTTLNPISLAVLQPASIEEAIIAGGVGLNTIAQNTLTFADAGQIPSYYTAYLNKDGVLNKYPQVLVCQASLNTIGGAAQTIQIQMVGPAVLRVALTQAAPGPLLSVTVQITGKDVNGNTLNDVVAFGAGWAETLPPNCAENPNQFVFTPHTYASATTYTITTRSNDGPNTQISIWAVLDPVTTPAIEDILPVADVTWDGFKICKLYDIRPINTILEVPHHSKFSDGAKALAQMTSLMIGAGYLFNYWLEDFNQPQYASTTYVEPSVPVDPGAVTTNIRKIGDGLDFRSIYVSRPIAPRPHSVGPYALRFIPIEPGPQFTFRVRVMLGVGSPWSRWFDGFADLVGPSYTLFLGAPPLTGTAPLVKWQMVVHGECTGMVVTYLTTGPDPGIGIVFDSGAYDESALG